MGSRGWRLPDGEQYIAFQSGVLGLSPPPGVPPESSRSRPGSSSSRQEPGGHLGPLPVGHHPSTLVTQAPLCDTHTAEPRPVQPQSSLPEPGWGGGSGGQARGLRLMCESMSEGLDEGCSSAGQTQGTQHSLSSELHTSPKPLCT